MASGWEKLKRQAQEKKVQDSMLAVLKEPIQEHKTYNLDEDFELIYDPSFDDEFQQMLDKQIENGDFFNVKLDRDDFKDRTQSPFAPPNKYNSRIVLSHPAIRPHYERYQQYIKNNTPTDHQRWMFEEQILTELHRLHLSEDSFDIPQKKNTYNKKFSGYEK